MTKAVPGVKSQKFDLSLTATVTIGRDENCDITINKPEVSSLHAAVYCEDDVFWVRDNDSSSGVKVNGLPIDKKQTLKFNDVIRVAAYTFTLICEFSRSKGGKYYYLEIRKIQNRSRPSTEVKKKGEAPSKIAAVKESNPFDREKSHGGDDLSSVPKAEKLEKVKNVEVAKTEKLEKVKNVAVTKQKKKASKSKKKKRTKKTSERLKKIGAGVAAKIQLIQLNKKTVLNHMKAIIAASLVAHFVMLYLASNLIDFGSKTAKKVNEVVLTLKDDEPIIDLPPVPEVEQAEPEMQEAPVGAISVNLDNTVEVVSASSLISEATENVQFADEAFGAGSDGVGDIKIGKGNKGVRNGTFMKRVLGSKGRYGNVDIRVTLIWDDYSDLDLNVETPIGELYHANRKVGGGVLDIDKNAASTERVRKPVENMIWGKADDGDYEVAVVFFDKQGKTPLRFAIEFEVFGDIYHYKGLVTEKNLNAVGKTKKEIAVKVVRFSVKEGRYLIRSSISDRPLKSMRDIELDLVVP